LLNRIIRAVKATRIAWDGLTNPVDLVSVEELRKVPPESKQVTMAEMIDRMPDRTPSYRFSYALLCDFVHPNLGSKQLVLDRTEDLGGKRMRYVLRRESRDPELLYHVLVMAGGSLRGLSGLICNDVGSLRSRTQVLAGGALENGGLHPRQGRT
jgi:hypothetical protein